MSRSKLLGRLNALMEPSPASADPEDMGDFDGTSAASSSNKRAAAGSSAWGLGGGSNDDDASDDDDDNRDGKRKTAGVGGGGALSKLRGDASMAASEWGERYASKKVSRQQLKAVRTNEDEENEKKEEDDEKDEEQSDEEEEFDKEEEGDEEEEDESEDDLSDLESEGSNEEGVDASSSGAVQASVFAGVGGKDSVDAQLAALAAEERDARPGGRSAGGGGGLASIDQRLRASRAKALLALYDGVFEFRIAQQAALHATNQLPTPQALAVALPLAPAALGAASRQLQGTLRHLCALREDLRAARSSQSGGARSEAPVDIAPFRSKRRRFDEDGDEEKDDEDEKDEEEDAEEEADDSLLGGCGGGEPASLQASSNRALALAATWRGVAAGFERSKPFWEATLEQWQRRAQVGGLAATSKKSFKVVNRPLFEQAAAALAARAPANHADAGADAGAVVSARALRKVHPPLSPETTAAGGSASSDALDTSVLDDTEFYHSQLRDFLASRGPALGGGSCAPVLDGAERAAAAGAAAARRRRTRRHGVDTKASKGRKLRYEVMPKLENFMFPVPPPEPPLNVAELFGSLFGKQHGLAGAHA